jgi:two-component system cell cycle response regulator DivK
MNPRPDFVLLDIDLPHDEAFRINQHIQSDPTLREIPVIALGAVIDFATQKRLQRDGFATFTTKPLPRRQFADLIRRILGGN